MAESYDTKVANIGGVTLTVSKSVGDTAGDRVKAFLLFLAKWSHAGKPPEGEIDNSLPSGPPAHPGNRPPGSGAPPRPDQGLPGGQPGGGGSPGTPTNPIAPGGETPSNDLPSWIAQNVDEVVKVVLKGCMSCNTAQPHK